ncbi:fungal-specific transcription factor domain-containing protein [Bisporella sp. PMI_857]|nr:fungal-specific transcription factor domain-containing protein [Bisporella sp. PMI_857]
MDGARGTLSCASCRQRNNCIARNCDCVYASYPRGRNSARRRDTSDQLDGRIRRLEHLINTITTQSLQGGGYSLAHRSQQQDEDTVGLCDQGTSEPLVQQMGSDASNAEALEIKPGRIVSNNKQTTYVSGTHWAAICNEYLNGVDLEAYEERLDPNHRRGHGPMLLEGLRTLSNMQDVLSDIPPRKTADRLVSRYFNSTELSIVLLHAPNFGQEYNRFWLNPREASTPWISLLFGVLAMGTFLYMQSEEGLPSAITNPSELMEVFQRRSTECLIISKYFTEPSDYTMEALMMNLQNEFVQRQDAHLGVWLLAGVAIRLAMRMGYHRDPGSYKQFSAFKGEMRRRVWACINSLDSLTSYQLGLPPMIQELQYDTQLPFNLLDEDFGPDSSQLPPSRPETELTPILYTITKAKFLSVFRTILNQASLGRTVAYEDVMALDHHLRNAQEAISPRFRMSTLEESVTVSPYLLIRRYSLELNFQKARCILHLHHMTKSYQDPKYNFSRTSCIEAAMAILTHQANILKEVQVGGILYRTRWLASSLQQNDFLLASMIICLEVSYRASEQTSPASYNDIEGFLKFSQRDLVEALRSAHLYLNELKTSSTECQRAYDILSVMLQKFSENPGSWEGQRLTSAGTVASANSADTFPPLEAGELSSFF